MSRASQTMRIDIPPDLKAELRLPGSQRTIMPEPEPIPQMPARTKSHSSLGDPDFQELFQSVYDGAIITTMAGKIVDANIRATGFLKYSRDELLSLNLMDIISGADSSTLASIQEGIKKDRFILIQAYCARQDKSLFPAEITVNPLTVGKREYHCYFIRDITWRRQAEDMLKTVHKAIQNAATGIAIADLEGQIDYVNQAAVRLWSDGESVNGRHLQDLVTDPDQFHSILKTVKAGENWAGEVIVTRTNSPSIHVQIAAASNRNSESQLTGMILSFLDISDRIRAQAAEKHAAIQHVMVESLGTACHHLGQPATVLLASLELLAKVKGNDKSMSEELLASSIDAAESLRTMLHNLNDLTEYHTTPYIEGQDVPGMIESRILDVNKR
ncbi:MAG: PAS domain-containing protein [bacterium]